MTGRQRILAAVSGASCDEPAAMPMTMLFAARQAGIAYRRYVLDHRALVEAQLLTAERFDIDHVSAISDPAREAVDCGATACFFDDQPPAMDEQRPLLADKARLITLKAPAPTSGRRMSDRLAAVALLRRRVGEDKCVEGWVEGPFAEAADLRGLNPLMVDLMDDPPFVRDLCEWTLALGVAFARAQVEAGADLIGIGDAAASLIGPELYREVAWPFEKRLVDAIHAAGARVRLHICGNTRPMLRDMGALGCDIVDLDSMSPVCEAREAMGATQVLLGNIDPVRVLLNGTLAEVEQAVAACHEQAGAAFIVGAGCEVPRDTPDANLRAMIRYARTARLVAPGAAT
jgi:MtaA/CmuA family methyltransferase